MHKTNNAWPKLKEEIETQSNLLAQIRAFAAAEELRFNLDYSQGFSLRLPHLAPMKRVTQTLSAATIVDLHEGRRDAAWQNLRAVAQWTQIYEPEPIIISHLVRIAVHSLSWNVTWEALQYPNWTDTQLAELQRIWQNIEFFSGLEETMGLERLNVDVAFDQMRQSRTAWILFQDMNAVSGVSMAGLWDEPGETVLIMGRQYVGYWPWKWWDSYTDELVNDKCWQAGIEAVRSFAKTNCYLPAQRQLKEEVASIMNEHTRAFRRIGWEPVGSMTESFLRKMVTAEVQRDMMVTGIALHRYRLRHGDWPPELRALVPQFLAAVPLDKMDGKPLRYRKQEDGAFLLYSVGDDCKDDGGTPTLNSKSRTLWKEPDWIWPQPATAQQIREFWKGQGANLE